MLAKLVLKSWAQGILPTQPAKGIGMTGMSHHSWLMLFLNFNLTFILLSYIGYLSKVNLYSRQEEEKVSERGKNTFLFFFSILDINKNRKTATEQGEAMLGNSTLPWIKMAASVSKNAQFYHQYLLILTDLIA